MRRHVLSRVSVVGLVLALAACDHPATIEASKTNALFKTASIEYSEQDAKLSNARASIFAVPREARIIFW